jgi:ADP-heptose:LPS heptosyltransferase
MKPRLLLVELHHLGDAVLSLPFVRGAQRDYDVHVLCRPATKAIYDLLARPPHVHLFEPPWADEHPAGARAMLDAVRQQGQILRPLDFAVAVSAWADARVAVLLGETRAAQRIGFPMTRGNYYAADLPWRRRRRLLGRWLEIAWAVGHPGRPLLTRKLHRASPDQPHLRCWEQIADHLGLSCLYDTPWLAVEPDPALRRTAERPLLAVHPHARLPSKQWPLDCWRQLLGHREVTEPFDLLEVLPDGPDALLPAKVRSQRTPDLRTLARTLAAADAVLCHDSLPAHLAAALGRPVITIFGSGEPDWFAPWGNRDRVVQRRVCPLHPCIDRCGMDRYLCLDRITVEDVLQRLRELPALP